MLKVAVFGANGRMGRAVTQVVSASPDAELVGACTEAGHETVGQDVGELAGLGSLGLPISGNAEEALANADVAIDFTLPAAVPGTQVQPAVLDPALKVVPTGTVSVSTTPVAFWLPRFSMLMVNSM